MMYSVKKELFILWRVFNIIAYIGYAQTKHYSMHAGPHFDMAVLACPELCFTRRNACQTTCNDIEMESWIHGSVIIGSYTHVY